MRNTSLPRHSRRTAKVITAPSSQDPGTLASFDIRQDIEGWCEIHEQTVLGVQRVWPLLYRSMREAEAAIWQAAELVSVPQ